MGKLLGLGAKSGCGFFIPKSKMASKMAAKKMNFLISNFQKLSNLLCGGGGTKIIFCPAGFCAIVLY